MPNVIASDGTQLGYRTFGTGDNVIILIHGWMVSGVVYDDLLKVWTPDARLIIPDLRGSGTSAKPDHGYSIQRYADDVLAIADAEGASKFIVVGHSMGGQIAQYLAATHPTRVTGEVLLCPVPASGVPLPEPVVQLFGTSGRDREKQRSILNMACRELQHDSLERLLDDAGRIPASCIRESFDAWRAGGFESKLDQIRCPTLVTATDDPFLPPAILQQTVVSRIRGARLAVLPGPGHYVQVERPAQTAALLQAFLAGCQAN